MKCRKAKRYLRIVAIIKIVVMVCLPIVIFFIADLYYTPRQELIERQLETEEQKRKDSQIDINTIKPSANTSQTAPPQPLANSTPQNYTHPPVDNGCRIIKTPRPPTEVRVDKTTNESRTIPGNDGSYLICADGVKRYEVVARPDVFVQGLKPVELEPIRFNYRPPEHRPLPPSSPIITQPVNPPPKQTCFNNGYSAGCLDY